MSQTSHLIEKDRVARSFLRGLPTYEDQAVVQRLVNERLLSLLVALVLVFRPQGLFGKKVRI